MQSLLANPLSADEAAQLIDQVGTVVATFGQETAHRKGDIASRLYFDLGTRTTFLAGHDVLVVGAEAVTLFYAAGGDPQQVRICAAGSWRDELQRLYEQALAAVAVEGAEPPAGAGFDAEPLPDEPAQVAGGWEVEPQAFAELDAEPLEVDELDVEPLPVDELEAEPQAVAEWEAEPQAAAAFAAEPQAPAEFVAEPQAAAGWEAEPQALGELDVEPLPVDELEAEPQAVAGFDAEPQPVDELDAEPQAVAGLDAEPLEGAELEAEPQAAGWEAEPQAAAEFNAEPQAAAGFDAEPQAAAGWNPEPQAEAAWEGELQAQDAVEPADVAIEDWPSDEPVADGALTDAGMAEPAGAWSTEAAADDLPVTGELADDAPEPQQAWAAPADVAPEPAPAAEEAAPAEPVAPSGGPSWLSGEFQERPKPKGPSGPPPSWLSGEFQDRPKPKAPSGPPPSWLTDNPFEDRPKPKTSSGPPPSWLQEDPAAEASPPPKPEASPPSWLQEGGDAAPEAPAAAGDDWPIAAEPEPWAEAGGFGLDEAHQGLLQALTSLPSWHRQEFEQLAATYGLDPDQAIQVLNDVAINLVGSPVCEGDDPIYVVEELARVMLG